MEQEIKEFLDKNKEALEILGKKIKNIDTVMGVNTVKEFQARQQAIRIINEWIIELWGVAYPEIASAEEDEDNIFRIIKRS